MSNPAGAMTDEEIGELVKWAIRQNTAGRRICSVDPSDPFRQSWDGLPNTLILQADIDVESQIKEHQP